MAATLYASVAAFLTLIFQYVAVAFPDALGTYYPGILDTIRQSEATLLIVFPIYLFLSWLIVRDMAAEPALHDFKLRKWLVYFTLFISAITIIIDLVVLIYNFLGGELTTPFILKIIAVLATAVAVFGYYFWDLRERDKKTWMSRKRAAWIASGIVLASIILGFVIAGTPGQQRARRFDEQRINDLQMLQGQILDYWIRQAVLPQQSEELEQVLSGFVLPRDPDTTAPYEYKQIDDLSFEICAQFQSHSGNLGSFS